MTAREQLLCFIAAADQPVDPIRIMKGMFVFTKFTESGQLPSQPDRFSFEPMSYGPCSPRVYDYLEKLVAEGLIEERPVPRETWSTYVVTDPGKEGAAAVGRSEPEEAISFLRALRGWCDRQTFAALLRRIYDRWPEYARNSVLPHLRPNG